MNLGNSALTSLIECGEYFRSLNLEGANNPCSISKVIASKYYSEACCIEPNEKSFEELLKILKIITGQLWPGANIALYFAGIVYAFRCNNRRFIYPFIEFLETQDNLDKSIINLKNSTRKVYWSP